MSLNVAEDLDCLVNKDDMTKGNVAKVSPSMIIDAFSQNVTHLLKPNKVWIAVVFSLF